MNKKMILYILYGVLVLVLAYAIYATSGFGLWKNKSMGGKAGQFQAVFLANGQVYFGSVSGLNSKFVTLKDVYYLQVEKQIQPTTETTQDQNKLTLIKLGNELHAPEDEMKINQDQIIFVENIKDDGKVMQAIKQYKESGPSAGSSVAPAPTATK